MEETLYTAGEIAKIAGVSLRTIRFYDTKGLLKPVSHSPSGYRYYNQKSIEVLQRILMLKYLGFSLEQIEKILNADAEQALDMDTCLSRQKELLLKRKEHLEQLISTIDMAASHDGVDKWNLLVRLLNLLSDDENVMEQYQNATNLEQRIYLHNYSTNPQGWMKWVFERLALKPNTCCLELGCGTGLLWLENINCLPDGLTLTLTDRSEGMLEQTRTNLEPFSKQLSERNIHIQYMVMDAASPDLASAQYDYIIANHMLYHVKNREHCLRTVYQALKPDGTFYCSTVGDHHMEELHNLVAEFDSRICVPYDNITSGFRLENAEPQLRKFFPSVSREDQENDLIVDNVDAIYNYVYSYPGNASFILDCRKDDFRQMLCEKLQREGAMYIHKSTGMFSCKKS